MGLLALLALVLLPSPARAHGIGGDAADRTVLGFVPLGFEHMLLGWDHLLFIGGVVLLSGSWRRAAKMITIFVVGHSTTLIAATMAGWQVDAGFVDVIIALSVVFVGAIGIFVKSVDWRVFGFLVLAFGLVHGLGLATRLQDIGLPEDGVLLRVIAFNVGVEIGQLTAIVALTVIVMLVSTIVGRAREQLVKKGALVALFVGGAVATSLVAYQAVTDLEQVVEAASSDPAGCTVSDRTEQFPIGGGHTSKTFYESGEATPLGDFGHSLGDGYVVVLYPLDLEQAGVDELRSLVTGPEGTGLLAGPAAEDTDEVKVINAYETMTCGELDVAEIEQFSGEWFESIQG